MNTRHHCYVQLTDLTHLFIIYNLERTKAIRPHFLLASAYLYQLFLIRQTYNIPTKQN